MSTSYGYTGRTLRELLEGVEGLAPEIAARIESAVCREITQRLAHSERCGLGPIRSTSVMLDFVADSPINYLVGTPPARVGLPLALAILETNRTGDGS